MTPPSPPRRLLVLNPNTSPAVTALLAEHVATLLCGAAVVESVTARLGAAYIASEAACAIAGHAALDAWAAYRATAPRPDAVLIGCFGDPGLFALRELCDGPVTGLAEAAFVQAARRSARGRFAIVTGGAAWDPMLRRLAHSLGFGQALAGVHTVAPSGIQLAADPAAALPLLAQACRAAARDTGADCVIVGGAGLAGMAARIQDQVPVPLIDSVSAGAQEALRLAMEAAPAAGPAPAAGDGPAWQGLSPALAARLSAR